MYTDVHNLIISRILCFPSKAFKIFPSFGNTFLIISGPLTSTAPLTSSLAHSSPTKVPGAKAKQVSLGHRRPAAAAGHADEAATVDQEIRRSYADFGGLAIAIDRARRATLRVSITASARGRRVVWICVAVAISRAATCALEVCAWIVAWWVAVSMRLS